MKSAAAMAVGVAGGQMRFAGLSSMFGNGAETGKGQGETGEPQVPEQETAIPEHAELRPVRLWV